MENVSVGKVGRFLKKSTNWFDSEARQKIFTFLAIILAFITVIPLIYMSGKFEYSEQEYIQLENLLKGIVVEGQYIDMSPVSDKSIQYTETYTKYEGNEEWDECKIEATKSNVKVTAIITKAEDNTLKIKTSYQDKAEYTSDNIFYTAIGIFGCSVCYYFVFCVSFFIFFFVLLIIKSIEKAILNRKKTT